MKTCSKCKKLLSESNFNWKIKNVKLQYHCKDCSRSYIKEHYKNNTKYYIDKAKKRNTIVKNKIFNFLGRYLLTHSCVDCGEKDVLVLEFDHRIPSSKFKEINKLTGNRSSLQKVKDEIQKCDVRCANCHRRKTSRETKSWRLKYTNLRP